MHLCKSVVGRVGGTVIRTELRVIPQRVENEIDRQPLLQRSFRKVNLHVYDRVVQQSNGILPVWTRLLARENDRFTQVSQFQRNIQCQRKDLGPFRGENERRVKGKMQLSPNLLAYLAIALSGRNVIIRLPEKILFGKISAIVLAEPRAILPR